MSALNRIIERERNAVLESIIAYEDGQLDEDETLALFQDLVDSGLAWHLQGHYGRAAAAYIAAGLVSA